VDVCDRGVMNGQKQSRALDRLIGGAPPFRAVIAQIPAVAQGDATVLIAGETGTGKELVARAIHYLGARAAHPFVPVNCGAIAESLLEDELFGHARGAFTDARSSRAGLVLEAHRGTLFLDEVDTLTLHAQVALLRVLQDRTVRPLGASGMRQVDVRFIAASNVPLADLVRDGTFRPDLFYRLNVLSLELPPLRARREDVLRLARHFLQKHALRGRPVPRLSPVAEGALLAHDWPGNVRELENAIIRGAHLCGDDVIDAVDLGLPEVRRDRAELPRHLVIPGGEQSFQEQKRQVVAAFERDYLVRLMSQHAGNVSRAARTAGKERRELGKLLKKHEINPREFAGTV
jgi:DNA-binding NtrC family response regulator